MATNPLHDVIDAHIKSFNPCNAHYRREHAPNRLYLPHGLTITFVHGDFKEHLQRAADYTTYMRRVKFKNISFAKLKECELCTKLHQKLHWVDGPSPDCEVCIDKQKQIHEENKSTIHPLAQSDFRHEM